MILEIAAKCTRCDLCRENCSFLQQHGFPGDIAESSRQLPGYAQRIAFSCSLCGLCAAVCPVSLNPARMFLNLRRQAVVSGNGDFPGHARILGYERRGVSPRYTWYILPENCNTVFFPGCSLPGAGPGQTLKVYEYLLALEATTGIVLDCCAKSSHDLGRQQYFEAIFFELREYLLNAGVSTVLVACPSCHQIFLQYGGELRVETIYERIAVHGTGDKIRQDISVTLHDSCAVRFVPAVHAAVREIIRLHGLEIDEMQHAERQTFCCGKGGAVPAVAGKLAKNWTRRRVEEAKGKLILTYCSGCVGYINRHSATIHLIDLIFDPQKLLAGKAACAMAPFTYRNRLRLKKGLQKRYPGMRTRERPVIVSATGKQQIFVPLFRAILCFLFAVTGVSVLWFIYTGR